MTRRHRMTQKEKAEYELKWSLQLKLDRVSHGHIRIQKQRAVIGEIYNRVRRGEGILTYSMQDPQLIPLQVLKDVLAPKWHSASRLWDRIQRETKLYKAKRRRVTHPWERSGQD